MNNTSHDEVSVSDSHSFLPLNMTIFCGQLFLALDESVSVKLK